MADDRLPLLRVKPSEVAERALVVGDPARAEQAAGMLEEVRPVGANREYRTWTGRAGGRRITVASHGVGSAGAGVCFEELARAGARVLVRAGTCGALTDELADGELVVATGAVRDDGLTPRLMPLSYPAVAHHEVVAALLSAAGERGLTARAGLVLATDLFYPSPALGVDWKTWQAGRVVAVEMELGALFVVASLHGLRAGGLLTVDGNPTRSAQDMSEYDPYRGVVATGVTRMLEIAIDALAAL